MIYDAGGDSGGKKDDALLSVSTGISGKVALGRWIRWGGHSENNHECLSVSEFNQLHEA